MNTKNTLINYLSLIMLIDVFALRRDSQILENLKKLQSKIGYDRKCRSLSEAEIKEKLDAGEDFTVRLKLPETGLIKVDDLVRGSIEYNYENLEDLVVVKTDGFPTYHLAHVVDDSLMGVTHVFRGTEWIPTSPMHALCLMHYL